MPKRFSDDARQPVLASAKEEARRRGDRRMGTEHLLLGLLHDEGSRAAQALDVSLAEARTASDALDIAALAAVGIEVGTLGEGPAAPAARRLPPLTSGARAVFKLAVGEAQASGSRRIGTAHFLLALLSLQRPDPAAELLEALGVDPAEVTGRLSEPAGGQAA
jgi:ATP-dependent Clp protease ATP-binding subunit ClpA